MELKTERLVIRPVRKEDWRAVQAIWEDFNASEYARYDRPHCTDDDDVRARIARWAEVSAGMEHMFFAVCLNDRLIGYTAFNIRTDWYEIGYCFHSAYHGRGYALESHAALFDAFRRRGITRFSAGTAMANRPSVALLEKLGFRQTGTEQVSFYQDAQGRPVVFEGGIFELITDA